MIEYQCLFAPEWVRRWLTVDARIHNGIGKQRLYVRDLWD